MRESTKCIPPPSLTCPMSNLPPKKRRYSPPQLSTYPNTYSSKLENENEYPLLSKSLRRSSSSESDSDHSTQSSKSAQSVFSTEKCSEFKTMPASFLQHQAEMPETPVNSSAAPNATSRTTPNINLSSTIAQSSMLYNLLARSSPVAPTSSILEQSLDSPSSSKSGSPYCTEQEHQSQCPVCSPGVQDEDPMVPGEVCKSCWKFFRSVNVQKLGCLQCICKLPLNYSSKIDKKQTSLNCTKCKYNRCLRAGLLTKEILKGSSRPSASPSAPFSQSSTVGCSQANEMSSSSNIVPQTSAPSCSPINQQSIHTIPALVPGIQRKPSGIAPPVSGTVMFHKLRMCPPPLIKSDDVERERAAQARQPSQLQMLLSGFPSPTEADKEIFQKNLTLTVPDTQRRLSPENVPITINNHVNQISSGKIVPKVAQHPILSSSSVSPNSGPPQSQLSQVTVIRANLESLPKPISISTNQNYVPNVTVGRPSVIKSVSPFYTDSSNQLLKSNKVHQELERSPNQSTTTNGVKTLMQESLQNVKAGAFDIIAAVDGASLMDSKIHQVLLTLLVSPDTIDKAMAVLVNILLDWASGLKSIIPESKFIPIFTQQWCSLVLLTQLYHHKQHSQRDMEMKVEFVRSRVKTPEPVKRFHTLLQHLNMVQCKLHELELSKEFYAAMKVLLLLNPQKDQDRGMLQICQSLLEKFPSKQMIPVMRIIEDLEHSACNILQLHSIETALFLHIFLLPANSFRQILSIPR